jgi:hypothetical protein
MKKERYLKERKKDGLKKKEFFERWFGKRKTDRETWFKKKERKRCQRRRRRRR